MATPNPPAVGSDSFQHNEQLHSFIAGTYNEPVFSSQGILNSLDMYNKFSQAATLTAGNAGALAPEVKAVWEAEAKWLKRSMTAIAKDPTLRNRFGEGWQGVVTLAPLLKKVNAEKAFMETLTPYAWEETDESKITSGRRTFT